jgi:hypothetical protein
MKATLMAACLIACTTAQVCIADEMTEEQVQALEQKCEAAREAKLKPLREAEIARCKAEKRNDDEYCERFFRDFGDASRNANGTTKTRMFQDLPECVTAFKARQSLAR